MDPAHLGQSDNLDRSTMLNPKFVQTGYMDRSDTVTRTLNKYK